MTDTAIQPIPKQGKYRRALAMAHRIAPIFGVALLAVVTCARVASAAPLDAAAIHSRVLPFDPHLDIDVDFDSDAAPATLDGRTKFDLPKVRRGGVKAVGLAVFVPQDEENDATLAAARQVAEAKHRIIAGLAARYPGQVELAHSPADVRRIAAAHKLAVVETIVNGGAFITDLDGLDAWAAKGVAIFAFVHAGHNRMADSSRPALVRGETAAGRSGGLSPLGKDAVERLNRLGVLIDVSQLSDAAFDDALRLSKAPVIATHSDLRTLVDNPRNLTDAQLDRLKANGGVVAINAFQAYLAQFAPGMLAKLEALKREFGLSDSGNPPISEARAKEYDIRFHQLVVTEPKTNVTVMANAVDYAVKRIGIDHVALSSDFNHGGGIIGFDNEGEAENVTAELVKHGYSEADIAKLWSGNVLRVWQAAQDEGVVLRREHAASGPHIHPSR